MVIFHNQFSVSNHKCALSSGRNGSNRIMIIDFLIDPRSSTTLAMAHLDELSEVLEELLVVDGELVVLVLDPVVLDLALEADA